MELETRPLRLEDMAPEILQTIAYEVRVLEPSDVLALARTSSWMRAALLGDSFSCDLHRSLAGFLFCVSKGWWRAARLGMERARGGRDEGVEWFNEVASEIRDDFVDVAAQCKRDQSSSSCMALVKEMVEAKVAPVWFEYTMACAVGEEAIVAEHLNSVTYEPWNDDRRVRTKGLVRAAGCGQVGVIQMLLADPRVDPAEDHCKPLIVACRHGEAGAVEALLTDRRINPNAFFNYPLQVSAASGFLDVVSVLMADERVDPSVDNNYALENAKANGHDDVVSLLLTDPRVSSLAPAI